MKFFLIETKGGYDFYKGVVLKKEVYNILPHGSPAPSSGYYNKGFIEGIKGVKFTEKEAVK